MHNQLEQMKEVFGQIETPLTLDRVIEGAVSRHKQSSEGFVSRITNGVGYAGISKRLALWTVTLLMVLGIMVNSNESLAREIYELPIVGNIAKMITFIEYSYENETSKGAITEPVLEYSKDQVVEGLINDMIEVRMNSILEEQAILDAEYKEAFLETGGTEATYRKIETTVAYEVYEVTQTMVSFAISKYQTLAPAYNEVYYYNIDLETGNQLTLKDFLGQDFADKVKVTVEEEMLLRMATSDDIVYDVEWFRDMEITEDRTYYVNEFGMIVVVFDKYEVAAGVYGTQEFVVGSVQ